METIRLEAKENTSRDVNLTLIEHAFIGSSVPLGDKLWDTKGIIEYIGKEKDPENIKKKLLTPLAFNGVNGDIGKINEVRSREKQMVGFFSLIDINQQMELPENFDIYLKLGNADEKGQISGRWEIGLIDDVNGVEVDASRLKVDPAFSRYFSLEKNPVGSNMILSFNIV
jgi:hypothetical protein